MIVKSCAACVESVGTEGQIAGTKRERKEKQKVEKEKRLLSKENPEERGKAKETRRLLAGSAGRKGIWQQTAGAKMCRS